MLIHSTALPSPKGTPAILCMFFLFVLLQMISPIKAPVSIFSSSVDSAAWRKNRPSFLVPSERQLTGLSRRDLLMVLGAPDAIADWDGSFRYRLDRTAFTRCWGTGSQLHVYFDKEKVSSIFVGTYHSLGLKPSDSPD